LTQIVRPNTEAEAPSKRQISPTVARLRGRNASLGRLVADGRRDPDDPELIEVRRDLAAEVLKEHAQRVVRDAPKLTEDQIEAVTALLRGAK
jgi:hypothetical protein